MRLPAARSLGARVLRQMALRIAVVIGLVTLASYWHVYRSVTATGVGTLAEYVRERGERESQRFLLAQDNLKVLMQTFLDQRAMALPGRDERAFDAAFARSADGAMRRRAGFDVQREPSAYMASRVGLGGATRREMMTMLDLVHNFGRAWNNRFYSAFLASLDGLAATYVPGVDWYRDIPPDMDFREYPWVQNAMPASNPERKPAWTSIWYDWVAERFAATCILPADLDGQFRYYAGASVLLDDIIQRARETGLAGTHNMIFRADGRLISHPDEAVMAALRANKGEFAIQASGDGHLKAIYEAVRGAKAGGVLVLDAYDEYLGVARIAGPDWFFVSVMPKAVLSRTAASTAQIVLWLGLASLLLELAIVGWIIRRQVSQPLARVMERLAAFGEGQWATRMASDGPDELGRLARTFNQMAQTLEEDQRQMRQHAESLEQKVLERTRQLEEKDRAKTRFLAAASHDLRQPIHAAALFVDSLKHSALDERQRRTVGYLDQSVRSVSELLDGLLDISRLDAGAVAPQISTFGLHGLLQGVATEFEPQAQAKGLRLRVRYPHGEVLVRSDAQLVMTILRNLVSNAVKYTRCGGILVGVRRRRDRAVLQVWDTGMGMPADQLERIYEEFYQIDNPERDRSKGFGIGLAVARRAADLLANRLACVSRVGHGTRFELELPVDSVGRPAPAPALSPARDSLAGRRVVVVEDDPLVAQSLALWLEEGGCQVSLYASAELALADADILGADGYLADYRLPGPMDGIAFLDAVRERSGHPIRGMVVTGDTSPAFIEQAERSGWRLLFKPVEPDLLLEAMGG